MKYIIIGLGNYGHVLAEELSALGHEIIGADISESRVDSIKDKVATAFVIENLRLLLIVSSGDDAARNAIKYGKVCSAVYPSMGFICSNMKVKKQDVKVISDFISQENGAEFELALSVRPIKLTNAVVVLAFRLLFKVLLKLLKGSKKNRVRKISQECQREISRYVC